MADGISIKIPINYSEQDGPYQLTKTLPETIKQNFKNMVMTVPGERIMDPDFGVGIHQLLFENEVNDAIETFRERLYDQVKTYLPFVSIINIETNFANHVLNVGIEYYISQLGMNDAIVLEVNKP
jgi:phage baseplate assembly protein W